MDRGSLARRTWAGFASFAIALAALLCLSAWSVTYWQGWAFLCVFLGSAVLITMYFLKHDPALIERRLKAGPAAEKEQSQKIIQVLATVFFIAMIVVPTVDHRMHWSSTPAYIVIIGDILVAVGMLIVFVVYKENSYTAATIQAEQGQTVASTGPYRIVRHPMYAGALIMMAGIPLSLQSFWGLLLIVPMTAILIWRLIDEEKFLSANLPGYTAYQTATRYRLIPFIF